MCIDRIKGFLLEPEKAFKKEAKTPLSQAYKYVLTLSVVFALLGGILGGLSEGPLAILSVIVTLYIIAVVGLPLWSLWIHLWAYAFGARKGLEQTMKAVFYAETPSLLLGWIPVVNLAVTIWSLILEILGLKALQGMSTGRAAAAVLVPTAIFVAILILIILALLAFLASLGALGGLGPILPENLLSFS